MSRIAAALSDREMRVLMLNIEKRLYRALETLPMLEKEAGSKAELEKVLHEILFKKGGASWDVPWYKNLITDKIATDNS